MESNRTTYIRKSTTFILGQGQKDLHTPKGVHETIPDQTISLRELLEKHTRGQQVPQFKPTYNDIEIPDIHKLDLVERDQLKEAAKKEVNDIQRAMAAATEKRKQTPSEPKSDTAS